MSSPWENDRFALESLEAMDRRFLPGTEQEIEFLVSELNLPSGDAVLDLGCGAGRHSIELARVGFAVTGIDISPLMLREARKRALESDVTVKLIEGDILGFSEDLTDQADVFGGAICICESGLGLLGWRKDLTVLQAVYSLLRTGSKLILTTYNGLRKYRGERIRAESFDYVRGSVHWQLPDDWNDGEKLQEIHRVYIPSEITILCEMAGFSKVEVIGCKPGDFRRRPLEPDGIEMMVVCSK